MIKMLLILPALGLCLVACSSTSPVDAQGAMAPCPDSPNCVSSRDEGDAFIEPFVLQEDPQQAWPKIINILKATPRTQISEQSPGYIHATATSLIFRFVDDIELELSPDGKTVNVRSASRTGHSDMGVNRERVEKLRLMLRQNDLIQ